MNAIKNYEYNLAYQLTAIIVPLITTPYISRVFGAEGVGSYAMSYSVAQYFCMFGMLGLNTYGMRQIAYCRDDKEQSAVVFWNLNYMRFITMGIALVVYLAGVFFVIPQEDKVVYFAQYGVLLASFFDISWYFAGKEEFKKTAIRNICVKLIGCILVFLLVKKRGDVWLYCAILAVSMFVGQIVMWKEILRRIARKPLQGKLIRIYLLESTRLFLPSIAISVYTSLDKIMLGLIVNDSEVGLYENSQKAIRIISTVTTTFATVMTPKSSNYYITGQIDKLRAAVNTSFRFMSLLAIGMLFGVIAVRETLVTWYFGPDFSTISTLLIVSAWLILTLSWSHIFGMQVLVACGREKQYTIAVSVAAVLNFLVNLALIPKFACMGAIISSVLAEYIGMFTMLYFSSDIIDVKELKKGLSGYFAAGIFMLIIVDVVGKQLGATLLSTVIQCVCGVAIYAAFLIILRDQFFLDILKKTWNRFS